MSSQYTIDYNKEVTDAQDEPGAGIRRQSAFT